VLHEFDEAVRACLESILCAPLSAEDWDLATLSTKHSGLGLRQCSKHCAGAYLASSIVAHPLCQQLDPGYSLDFEGRSSAVSHAVADFNEQVLPEARFSQPAEDPCSQRHLSTCVDNKALHDLKAKASTDTARRAHLELTAAPHAGSWLHAVPSPDTGNHMDPLLFRTSVLRWLRSPIFSDESACPLCEGVMDKYGDHCLVCPAGGDRTKRHNHLRNIVYHHAAAAGLNPELEKPGLLQPRPLQEVCCESGARTSDPNARRPADVYLPRWRRGLPMALDFAVTSGQRNATASIRDPSTAVASYEAFKRTHLDTERLCSTEGLGFTPMVVEAVGGSWGPAAQGIFAELAKAKSQISGEPAEVLLGHLVQNLGVALHRENARAVLRRARPPTSVSGALLVAATALHEGQD